MAFSGEYMVEIEEAQKIERELADMTKQRDHYKAACDQYSEDEMLCKLQEVTKQRDALAEALSPFVTLNPLSKRVQEKWHGYVLNAKQALAATKGGSHE
jgi:hypothetical protein